MVALSLETARKKLYPINNEKMMSDEKGKTVTELASLVGGQVLGDGRVLIKRVANIESAQNDDIAFLEDIKLMESLSRSLASCVIIPDAAKGTSEVEGKCLIYAARPKLAFALIAEVLHPRKAYQPQIHPTSVVSSTADLAQSVFVASQTSIGERVRIGERTQVHHGVSVGDDVIIGDDCIIHPNVTLYDGVRLGSRIILHAGVVIGADGFGYVPDEKNFRHKFPQIGTVILEDDVEIGAGTCIDRGALGQTRIGRGTKIDNLVQIAHNVQIGERVVIAAQTGISGSTVIEDDAVIGGQVGLGDHARVQGGAIIGSKAGILPGKIVRPGVWWGIPVQRLEDYKRLNAHMNRLPQLREAVKELQRKVKELEEEIRNRK